MLNFGALLAVWAAALIACEASAIPPISIKGSKFFVDGKQFFLKGVAYQGIPNDPLVNTEQCGRDAELMKSIGCNSIRVYNVNPHENHNGCMKVFEDAGIYVWLDLDTFHTSIDQNLPVWNEFKYASYKLVVDAFHRYNNVAGFWIGNEVINTKNGSMAAPYLKAASADIKSYIAAKKYRKIPVGYAAADIVELRPMQQNYLACGSDPSERIDFFGLNSFEWCGQASYDSSGYVWLQATAKDYPLPIFFSETGCNVGGKRNFKDQAAIFGPEMSKTWSGAIVYEWVQQVNHYGLVDYPKHKVLSGKPIKIQPDFDNLANQWKSVSPVEVAEKDYHPNTTIPACPAPQNGWLVDGDVPLPRLYETFYQGTRHTIQVLDKETVMVTKEMRPPTVLEVITSTEFILVPPPIMIPLTTRSTSINADVPLITGTEDPSEASSTSWPSPKSTSSESMGNRNDYTKRQGIADSLVIMITIAFASFVVIAFL